MKRTSAIICEFNPFHNGHAHLFSEARKRGAENIICIMSGNFVQRGEIAIADKFSRAEAALLSGADLVLELPMPFSAAGAEYFAGAAIEIADRLAVVDELIFGSESGDINALSEIAKNQLSDEFSEKLSALYTGDMGYASASQLAYESLYGNNDVMSSPNNILAIEYIKSIIKLKSEITPVTIKREDNFLSESIEGEFPSASALRSMILRGEAEEIRAHMPKKAYEVLERAEKTGSFPTDIKKYGLCILSALRLASPDAICQCEGISGGLHNRIIRIASEAKSYDELLSMLSTKKYTDARLRRSLLFSALGIKHEDMYLSPFCTKLLAANEKGRSILSDIRKKGKITVVTKTSDKKAVIEELCENKKAEAMRLFEIEKKSEALFTLCMKEPKEASFYEKMSPFVVK